MKTLVELERTLSNVDISGLDLKSFFCSTEFKTDSDYASTRTLFGIINKNLFSLEIKDNVRALFPSKLDNYYTVNSRAYIYAFFGKRVLTLIFFYYDCERDGDKIVLKTKTLIKERINMKITSFNTKYIRLKPILKEKAKTIIMLFIDLGDEIDLNILIKEFKDFSMLLVQLDKIIAFVKIKQVKED